MIYSTIGGSMTDTRQGRYGKRRFVTFGLVVLAACAGDPVPEAPISVPAAGLEAISVEGLAAAIGVLAHDSLEGRAPGTAGEDRTVRFLSSEFQKLGLVPGNGDSWTQDVPLVSITPSADMVMEISGDEESETLAYKTDFVATTERVVDAIALDDSELVFVGYGIVAPEYGWNDYEGLNATGKTVVILVNDPGYVTQDPDLFTGRAMTYYGRWTYKYEEAARQGAAGALIVHRTGPAGYPWAVVENGWSGPQFGLEDAGNAPLLDVGGWITEERARGLFSRAGLDFDQLDQAALSPDFRPVPLGTLTVSVPISNSLAKSSSRNFLAVLPGAERPEEFVIYTAHYDHFGIDPTIEGDDKIYNGARDNASGTAGLLEVARGFVAALEPPDRSIMFLAVTAEEQGLLGSKYYASHPVVPLDLTAAVVNMDGLITWGATHDITVVGHGNSELDDYAEWAASMQDRVLVPDPHVEKGFFYRSDHFEFAKKGVPAFYTHPGNDMIDGGVERGQSEFDEYVAERYHKPTDEVDPTWDLAGAVQELELYFMMGWRIANENSWPNWREGNEFRGARDAMMAGEQ
jgi:Zn-dependent M28 family amino/carboxypeptidase